MYANDTNMLYLRGRFAKIKEHDLNIKVQKLSLRLKNNIHSLNIKKTCTMTFSNITSVRNRINNIYIDDTQTDTVSHIQFLGVIIYNKIKWNEHIKCACNNI